MKIRCLFGSRQHSHSLDQLSIELMVAWDEYCVDENSEGFEEDCKKAKASWGSDLHQWREIDIEVDEKALHEMFRTGTLEGVVQ